ncbi:MULTISPECIES: response regulator transcription factor [unclassified Rathayibacter]|uniref:response regulator transcription factor n=1 Tax=unclassified Rathayibacter TaxID=2609250 RepID=UPI000F4C59D4|nr:MULTISPECIES: response regulator transcription factor [unclassified Rathayibacter]MCJ1684113.1 response regulator transcription factor [Rathayibacter sp. VKM Ac-2928]ROP48563.1 LuxR family two component transcriptional regulator [Rathayibacter sp. PhB186]ROS49712.1 LuxR family two component transcriptional regulator [Rathayibacter sp. PhB185]
MTTVLVVDDQPLIRQAVTDILSSESGIEVVGEARTGREAVELATRLRPDVVLMDIRMPELDGIGATALICADPELAATKVLILTTFEEDEYLIAALRAGAGGFLGKGAEPEEIAAAVRAVHAGDSLLSPAATRSLITRYVLAPQASPPLVEPPEFAQLTDREREVLLLVARGRSNQEIADDLVISPHTAKTHVNRIMTKLSAHDRAQLVIAAYESGLLTPGA